MSDQGIGHHRKQNEDNRGVNYCEAYLFPGSKPWPRNLRYSWRSNLQSGHGDDSAVVSLPRQTNIALPYMNSDNLYANCFEVSTSCGDDDSG